jgi:tRNA-intron endonuclease
MVKAIFQDSYVLTEASDSSRLLAAGSYGVLLKNSQVKLSLIEAAYLYDAGKIEILSGKKNLVFSAFLKKAIKLEKQFFTRFSVFKDLRNRGYIVKTALKFGADFRVYDKGIKPGDDHAKWVVFPVSESDVFSWHDFSAKNRVAHSTKKRLMIGVVDDEGDVTYYEIKWSRP